MHSNQFERRVVAAFFSLAVVSFGAGCGKKDTGTGEMAATPDTNAAASTATTGVMDSSNGAMAAGMLSDAQIAEVLQTANSLDSAGGAAAASKVKRGDVRKFAQQMVTDHGTLNKSLKVLADRLAITPQASDLSASLEREAASMKPTGTGVAYDKSYLDNEVSMHQKVLRTLDETLIPQARNADLKTLLTQARETISGHLQSAQQLTNVAAGGQ